MDWFWSFLVYSIPFWLQVLILAGIIGVPSYLVVRMIWGAEVANRLMVPFLLVLGAIGAGSKARQSGYQDRRAEEEKALDKAEDFAEDKRHEIDALPDAELNDRLKKWER